MTGALWGFDPQPSFVGRNKSVSFRKRWGGTTNPGTGTGMGADADADAGVH